MIERMANKTSSNLKSQDLLMKTAIQSQLARVKKEEEEELWISGEELYTEGSSDEEELKTQTRSLRKVDSNRSSRASSANPTEERSGRSPIPRETKTKTDNVYKHNENRPTFADVLKSNKTLSSTESQRTQISSVTESTNSITRDVNSTNSSNDEDQLENTEISWKAKRAVSGRLLYDTLENEIQDEVRNLDNVVQEISDRLKRASEETLSCQYENRKRLENILSFSPMEIGKLAENTRQFFQLCPKYMMLSGDKVADVKISTESNISFTTNDITDQVFQNKDSANPLNFTDETINVELCNLTEKERISNLTNYVNDVNNKMMDSVRNPYIIDKETEAILLEIEEKVAGKHMESCANVSNSTSVISISDSISTINSSRNIEKDVSEEVIQKAAIVDPSSILEIGKYERGI